MALCNWPAEVQALIHAAVEREAVTRRAEVDALRAELAALREQARKLVDRIEVLDDHRQADLRRALTLGELEAGRAGRYSG